MAKKKANAEKVNLYKVLVDGCSIHGGSLEWSLPDGDKPGNWHEIEGDLVRCRNGLHLTTDPAQRWDERAECYLVEAKGEVLGNPARDEEIVARKVRLLRRLTWAELAEFGITPEGVAYGSKPDKVRARKVFGPAPVPKPAPKGPSPTMKLLMTVWENRCGANEHSWRRVNDAMGHALMLAINGGLPMHVDDIAEAARTMRGGYWMGSNAERFFTAAVEAGHTQACIAYETWAGRPAFMWEGKRLHVGSELIWSGRQVSVTSIGPDALIACAYKRRERWDDYRVRIEKRFSITMDELKRAERDRKVEKALVDEASDLMRVLAGFKLATTASQIAEWTPEQRAEVREWARLAEGDAYKRRVRPPQHPECLREAVAAEGERRQTERITRLRRERAEIVEHNRYRAERLTEIDAELERHASGQLAAEEDAAA